MNEEKNVQTLIRALTLIEILSDKPEGCRIKCLSEKAELNKSTVHRLLQTLVHLGYVEQKEENEQYRLGVKILALSSKWLESLDLRTIARKHLKKLCNDTGESIQLSVRNASNAVFIDKIENPDRYIRMYSQVGKSIPLYCSSSGKALLAWLTNKKILSIMKDVEFIQFTQYTIINIHALIEQLQNVRQQGYAVDWLEHDPSVFCVACPIFDNSNSPIAAISIAATILHTNPEKIPTYAKEVQKAAMAVSQSMGCIDYEACLTVKRDGEIM
jgi:IclR family KDG regulon transcriptional repressor